jgi:hypothetical protein
MEKVEVVHLGGLSGAELDILDEFFPHLEFKPFEDVLK